MSQWQGKPKYGTELVSIGLEWMHGDPVGLAHQDPDLFRLIYAKVLRTETGQQAAPVQDLAMWN